MKSLFCLGLVLATAPAFAQIKLNLPLQRELDSILVQDQKYRYLMAGTRNGKADSLEITLHIAKGQLFIYALTNMQRVDSSNLRRIEAIVRRYGYPGKSLVGTPANETVWYVIQHSDKIPKYLPLIKAAAEQKEIPFWMYAQMLDRKLMDEGQAQVYGTQGASYNVRNKTTNQPETVFLIWPIKDAAHVDERRRQAGSSNTLAENAASLGIPYKPVSLNYAKQLAREAAQLAHAQH